LSNRDSVKKAAVVSFTPFTSKKLPKILSATGLCKCLNLRDCKRRYSPAQILVFVGNAKGFLLGVSSMRWLIGLLSQFGSPSTKPECRNHLVYDLVVGP